MSGTEEAEALPRKVPGTDPIAPRANETPRTRKKRKRRNKQRKFQAKLYAEQAAQAAAPAPTLQPEPAPALQPEASGVGFEHMYEEQEILFEGGEQEILFQEEYMYESPAPTLAPAPASAPAPAAPADADCYTSGFSSSASECAHEDEQDAGEEENKNAVEHKEADASENEHVNDFGERNGLHGNNHGLSHSCDDFGYGESDWAAAELAAVAAGASTGGDGAGEDAGEEEDDYDDNADGECYDENDFWEGEEEWYPFS